MKNLQEGGVVEAALPLSFALGVGLGVVGTLAGPPFTGALYLAAVLMSAGVAYFLLGKRGWENESPKAVQRFDEERAYWHGEAERLGRPEHEEDDDGSASNKTFSPVLFPAAATPSDRGHRASDNQHTRHPWK